MTALRSSFLRLAQARSLAPLVCEQSFATAPSVSGSTTITCPTVDRLYFAGGRIGIIPAAPGQASSRSFQIAEIQTVNSGSLTLTTPLTSAVNIGDRIAPLMEVEPMADLRGKAITSHHAQSTLALRSSPARGSSIALPATIAVNTPPAGAQTYAGLPIFDVWPDWADLRIGVARSDRGSSIGDGRSIAFSQDRGVHMYDLSFVFSSRAAARRLLAWFDAMRGRSFGFWFVSPVADFASSLGDNVPGGTSLVVEPIRYDERFGLLASPPDHIAIVSKINGVRSVQIRKILATTLVPDNANPTAEILTLDAALTQVNSGELDRISFAHQARFADDELTERWITTEHCKSGVRVVETLHDMSVEVGVGQTCPSPPPGVTYDCTPPPEIVAPPAGNYRLATTSTFCTIPPGQPNLYLADGVIQIGVTDYPVIQSRGALYVYRVKGNDPLFTEAAIGPGDLFFTDLQSFLAAVAFSPLADPQESCAFVTCRQDNCDGNWIAGNNVFINKADCDSMSSCAATVTLCSGTASLNADLGCPQTPNAHISGDPIGQNNGFMRICTYNCAAIPNVTDCP